jgi:hypothetical protein
MVDRKRIYIILHMVGTFILVLSVLSTPIFWYMQLMQVLGTMLGALIIGVGLILMFKK